MNNLPATILIVDDEVQNRKLLEALLLPEGYLTVSVSSGMEALEQVAASAPDLILLDIMMPQMNGYEVVTRLKANPVTSSIPVIMITAQIDRNARVAGLHAGAEEFLTKPVDRIELWLRIRNLLRLKAYTDLLRDQGALLEAQVQARTLELQRFRTAMDASGDGIFLASRAQLRLVEANATLWRMLGCSRAELLQASPALFAGTLRMDLAEFYDAIIADPMGTALCETTLMHRDTTEVQVEVRLTAQRSGQDWLIIGAVRDISERKAAEQRLHHLAHYDALTGLPNRTLYYEIMARILAESAESGTAVAIFCIDLDQFKHVNDSYGHACGDELLRQFSNRLVECARTRDTVGRLSGDEFSLILALRDGQETAGAVANSIREILRAPFDLNGHRVAMTASIGIAVYPVDGNDLDSLIKYADVAMYRAKQAGRDTFRFFTAQMNVEILARAELEVALRVAVDDDQFVLHYQPKAQIASGQIAGFEALIRWQRPGHGLVSPGHFISVLEETGLIIPVGRSVIAAACKQIGLWLRSDIGPVRVSVNVSGRQFMEGDLEGDILAALEDNCIAGELLELELTESSLMANTERTLTSLTNLRRCGVQISIDDFGTGYSSLAYLRRFPIDTLKIDIAFIRDLTRNADDAAIVLAIICMAHSLKIEVVAEGVETLAQLHSLQQHQCDYIQGYYFSPPLPLAGVESMLREDRRLPVISAVA